MTIVPSALVPVDVGLLFLMVPREIFRALGVFKADSVFFSPVSSMSEIFSHARGSSPSPVSISVSPDGRITKESSEVTLAPTTKETEVPLREDQPELDVGDKLAIAGENNSDDKREIGGDISPTFEVSMLSSVGISEMIEAVSVSDGLGASTRDSAYVVGVESFSLMFKVSCSVYIWCSCSACSERASLDAEISLHQGHANLLCSSTLCFVRSSGESRIASH